MKKTLMIIASAFLLFSCDGGVDQEKITNYQADVCSCALDVTNQEEWDACNEKRKGMYSKLGADKDDVAANEANDAMISCLADAENF